MSKICFIGSGNMAESIIGGILDSGLFNKKEILASDVNRERLSYINLKYGVNTCLNDAEKISNCEIVILSIKPQNFDDAMLNLLHSFNSNALFISILAGIETGKIKNYLLNLNQKPKIVRVMPNIGAFIKKSVSAIFLNENISDLEKTVVEKIFKSIGTCYFCSENDINKMTAVSGSGPAYLFYFHEAFVNSAVQLGLEKDLAENICLETLEGAMQLLSARKSNANELRAKVTSKGGTTEAAITYFESNKFFEIFNEALRKAYERAIELGK